MGVVVVCYLLLPFKTSYWIALVGICQSCCSSQRWNWTKGRDLELSKFRKSSKFEIFSQDDVSLLRVVLARLRLRLLLAAAQEQMLSSLHIALHCYIANTHCLTLRYMLHFTLQIHIACTCTDWTDVIIAAHCATLRYIALHCYIANTHCWQIALHCVTCCFIHCKVKVAGTLLYTLLYIALHCKIHIAGTFLHRLSRCYHCWHREPSLRIHSTVTASAFTLNSTNCQLHDAVM